MSKMAKAMNWCLRRIFQTICQIQMDDFKRLPAHGPYILVGNHVNFLEVPVILSHIDNPKFTGVAKKETWDNPFLRVLFNQWGIIPIDRNLIDREAFRRSVTALKEGKILAISPEGTRSKNGKLLQGKPGVIAIAMLSQAPFIPVGLYGYEDFWENLKHLRRTEFHLVVGQPFRLKISSEKLSKDDRQAATDEIMYKIAELLPARYRGHYQFDGAVQYRFVDGIAAAELN